MLINKILKTPIYNIVKKTPLQWAPILSDKIQNNIFFKREDYQKVKSFKIRGAHQFISNLSQNELDTGLIAASAGNHAQGVAMSSKYHKCKSTIIMPTVTPSIKWKSVKKLGSDVELYGDTFDEAYKYAIQIATDENKIFVPPFNHIDIIAGQGTIGMEICNDWDFTNKNIDAVFIPIGGGGLIAGISKYIKELYPNVKIIGVESIGATSMSTSIKNNKITTLDYINTFADGVAVKTPGTLSFEYVKQYVDDIIQCTNDEICEAIQYIYEENRTIVEPAGALSTAGLIKYCKRNNYINKNVISILSGSNMNFTRLKYIAECSTNNEILLSVKIPEHPGSLQQFCNLLNSPNITEFNYRCSDINNAYIFVGMLLDDISTKSNIIKILNDNKYNTIDITENDLAKTHIRHQVGGKCNIYSNELLYTFEFPERQNALLHFLIKLSKKSNNKWNITQFHYRSCGSSVAKVLCGLNVEPQDKVLFESFLNDLSYNYKNETNNIVYSQFN